MSIIRVSPAVDSLVRDLQHFQLLRQIRLERTQTIEVALKLVNRRHKTFQSLGFDTNFLFNEIFEEIEPFLYGGATPTPQALANAWAAKFQLDKEARSTLARRVLPMMNDFVYLLETGADPCTVPTWLGSKSAIRDLVLQT